MKTFARIENSVVREVLIVDELPDFHPDLIWVDAPDGTVERQTYVGGVFGPVSEPPGPTVRELRTIAYAEELSDGNPTSIEALGDMVDALTTEVAALRTAQGGTMTPDLADKLVKITSIKDRIK